MHKSTCTLPHTHAQTYTHSRTHTHTHAHTDTYSEAGHDSFNVVLAGLRAEKNLQRSVWVLLIELSRRGSLVRIYDRGLVTFCSVQLQRRPTGGGGGRGEAGQLGSFDI